MEPDENNSTLLAYSLSIQAEDLYNKGYYTSSLDKFTRAKNYYLESKKELKINSNNKFCNKNVYF